MTEPQALAGDLVERLRSQTLRIGNVRVPDGLCEEAATTIEALRSEVERLTTLLNGRDAFIVERGLWLAFVDSLPLAKGPDHD